MSSQQLLGSGAAIHFILSDLSFLWTPIEKRTRLIELEGTVLSNRLLWLGVALAALAVTYLGFRFAHRTEGSWWGRRVRRRDARSALPAGSGATTSPPVAVPQIRAISAENPALPSVRYSA